MTSQSDQNNAKHWVSKIRNADKYYNPEKKRVVPPEDFQVNYRFIPQSTRILPSPCHTQFKQKDREGLIAYLKQDITLPDTVSGRILYELQMKSPLLAGSDPDQVIVHPVKLGDDYVLPGRALRGMLRSVLKIITAGEFGLVNCPDEKMGEGLSASVEANNFRRGYLKDSYADLDNQQWENDNQLDWTDAMLGLVDTETTKPSNSKQTSEAETLLSRVKIGFARLADTTSVELWPEENNPIRMPGAQPHPTYGPHYLAHTDESHSTPPTYCTADDNGRWTRNEKVEFAGRKRYPIVNITPDQFEAMFDNNLGRKDGDHWTYLRVIRPKIETTDKQANFIEAKFEGHIDFENLLPCELGALLWALSLGDENAFRGTGRYRHSLGHLKYYFLGQLAPANIKLELYDEVCSLKGTSDSDIDIDIDIEYFLKAYTDSSGYTETVDNAIDSLLICCDPNERKITKDSDWDKLKSNYGLARPPSTKVRPNYPAFQQLRTGNGNKLTDAQESIKKIIAAKGGLLRL